MENQTSKNIQFLSIAIIVAAVIISGTILYTNYQNRSSSYKNSKPTDNQLSPEQGRVQVSVDNDSFLGNKNAPLTMIEFSDFQCPFCRSFFIGTLPEIKKEYIDTGKLKFVYRDFPLTSIHPGATPAAEGAECAKDQGKFWQMHDKIFEEQQKQGQGTIELSSQDIKNWAAQIGLNTTTFNQCLDSGKYKSEVQKDAADGLAAGVQGTPAFFIGKSSPDGNIDGTLISGAQPYENFKAVIESMLSEN